MLRLPLVHPRSYYFHAPPKTRLCNNLIISVLQRRKKQGVEVAEKFLAYFHGPFSNSLISK